MRKRIVVLAVALALLVSTTLSMFGGGTARAHEGGHPGGCSGFGELVSSVLAGPSFGAFLSEFAPSAPMAVSGMVDGGGHAFCD